MKTLHILGKDVRHLWPELTLSLALTAGYAATDNYFNVAVLPFLHADVAAIWVQVLMALSWCFVIARAVHDEPLVGDRQFWVTRPYGWGRLLMSKIFFLTLFVALPLFLADLWLLHQQGLLHPAALPLLLAKVLITELVLGIPLIALASMTPGLNRMFLIVVGLFMLSLFVLYLNLEIFHMRDDSNGPWPTPLWFALGVFFLSAFVVIVLQYARRATTLSNSILCGTVVAVIVLALIAFDAKRPISEDKVPGLSASESSPFQAQIDTARLEPTQRKDISVEPYLPLKISGIASGNVVKVNSVRIRQSDTAGASYEAPPAFYGFYHRGLSNNDREGVSLGMFPGQATSMEPIRTVVVTYDVTELVPDASTVIPAAASFRVPDAGLCLNDGNQLRCLYPVRGPRNTEVHWTNSETCGQTSEYDSQVSDWLASNESMIEEPFGPIAHKVLGPTFGLFEKLSPPSGRVLPAEQTKSVHSHRGICPGSPITFTSFHVARRRLVTFTFQNVDVRLLAPESGD